MTHVNAIGEEKISEGTDTNVLESRAKCLNKRRNEDPGSNSKPSGADTKTALLLLNNGLILSDPYLWHSPRILQAFSQFDEK